MKKDVFRLSAHAPFFLLLRLFLYSTSTTEHKKVFLVLGKDDYPLQFAVTLCLRSFMYLLSTTIVAEGRRISWMPYGDGVRR